MIDSRLSVALSYRFGNKKITMFREGAKDFVTVSEGSSEIFSLLVYVDPVSFLRRQFLETPWVEISHVSALLLSKLTFVQTWQGVAFSW